MLLKSIFGLANPSANILDLHLDFSDGSKMLKNGRANARLANLKRKDKAITNHFRPVVFTT